jgi:DNA-binding transcriptional ArsR family regulator
MTNRKGMMKNSNKLNKGARTYLKSTVKAASHPIRNKILKVLKGGAMSTPDLQDALDESRYNLYHHLDILVNSNLIVEIEHTSKAKYYELAELDKPNASVYIFTEDDFKKDYPTWNNLLNVLEILEGKKIPIRGKIVQAEIHLIFEE